MRQRGSDLALAILACVTAFFLSWPFWRDFTYWPVSHAAWLIYFIGGFLLAVYVFYVFIISLHMLFVHDSQELAASSGAALEDATDVDGAERP